LPLLLDQKLRKNQGQNMASTRSELQQEESTKECPDKSVRANDKRFWILLSCNSFTANAPPPDFDRANALF
jgi:hypothetical protein